MKYTFNAQEVAVSGYQNIDELCNGVTLINQGNGGVFVNNVYLNASPLNVAPGDRFAGESLAIGGNEGEILTGRLQIVFETQTAPLLIMVQKYYLPH